MEDPIGVLFGSCARDGIRCQSNEYRGEEQYGSGCSHRFVLPVGILVEKTADVEDAMKEASTLLGLQPGLQEDRVGYGLIQQNDTEIAMLTRSMLQIMIELT